MFDPPPVCPGDRVALIAPSSPHSQADFHLIRRAVDLLHSWDLRVLEQPTYASEHDYLCGSDAFRAQCFLAAYTDPTVKAILCTRGGYGTARLCALLDDRLTREHRKIVIGYSDVTALLLYVQRVSNIVTFHGPNLAVEKVAGENPSPLTVSSLRAALFGDSAETYSVSVVHPGRAEGVLVGGNLTLLAHSIGTRDEIDTEGKVLLLEDRGRQPRHVDRLITHLRSAGKLRHVVGIVFGNSLCQDATQNAVILKELLGEEGVPVVVGLPTGHGPECVTVPLGRKVLLEAGGDAYLELLR